MNEAPVDVKTPDGIAGSTLYTPTELGAWPGAAMLPDSVGGARGEGDAPMRLLSFIFQRIPLEPSP